VAWVSLFLKNYSPVKNAKPIRIPEKEEKRLILVNKSDT